VLLSGLEFDVNNSWIFPVRHSLRLIILSL